MFYTQVIWEDGVRSGIELPIYFEKVNPSTLLDVIAELEKAWNVGHLSFESI